MVLLNICGVDMGKNMVTGSYQCAIVRTYRTWTDANYIVHKNPTGKKIEGSCAFRFSIEQLREFMSLIHSALTDVDNRIAKITVWVPELGETKEIYAYIDDLKPVLEHEDIYQDLSFAFTEFKEV